MVSVRTLHTNHVIMDIHGHCFAICVFRFFKTIATSKKYNTVRKKALTALVYTVKAVK